MTDEILDNLASYALEDIEKIFIEVLALHGIVIFNPNTKSVEAIDSVSIAGECIQLNLEECEV